MCDEGRLNYKFVNTDRIRHAYIDRKEEKLEASLESGLNELRSVLGIESRKADTVREKKSIVVLASATCTLEEMFLLKKLADAFTDASYYIARHVPDGEEDERLRRADRHPNAKSAELLGVRLVDFRPGAGDSVDVPEGAVLFAVGFDYGIGEPLEKFFQGFAEAAIVSARETDLTKAAQLVLPGLTFAEKEGLIVNFEGHIQRLSPALDNLWDRTAPWELIAGLISSLTGESRIDGVASIRATISKEETAFSSVNLNAVGSTGVRLAAQAV
jgi:NADH-quinone oxidoreductase subunit G